MSITVRDLMLVLFLCGMVGWILWGAATDWDLSDVIITPSSLE